VSTLLDWLDFNENFNLIAPSKLVLLLNELNSHPIGLTANGITTITYKFLTTVRFSYSYLKLVKNDNVLLPVHMYYN